MGGTAQMLWYLAEGLGHLEVSIPVHAEALVGLPCSILSILHSLALLCILSIHLLDRCATLSKWATTDVLIKTLACFEHSLSMLQDQCWAS